MFKRTFWFTTGATAGFGGAMWLRRRVLQVVQRYTPEHVQADVTDSMRRWRADVQAAISEGRAAMVARETTLRAELGAGDAPVAAPPAADARPDPGERRRPVRAVVAGRRRRRRSRHARVG